MESKKLSLGFSGRIVLSDVNVSLRRGSITALIGPTGSGKSTFLRTLNRMNDRVPGFNRDGDVTYDELSLWAPSVDLLTLRRRVGMLFQRPNPFPMSIKDNVVAGVKAHRIAKGKQLDVVCERRLTEVGLWDAVKDRLNDSPFRLSGWPATVAVPGACTGGGARSTPPRRAHLGPGPGDHGGDRGAHQDADPGTEPDRRDPQPGPGQRASQTKRCSSTRGH